VNNGMMPENGPGRPSRYIPDWERLDAAIKRMMVCGFNRDEAREDLCHAIADSKVQVRVALSNPRRIFSGGNVRSPVHLKPADIDWNHSRPTAPWWCGPMPGQHQNWDGGKEDVKLVEVSTADVIDLFCTKDLSVERGNASAGAHSSADAAKFAQEQTGHATERTAATGGKNARRPSLAERIAAELRELYPKGKPAKKFEEIRRDLKARPNVGGFETRTLQTALRMAWSGTSGAA
jgi:hypothetical protein